MSCVWGIRIDRVTNTTITEVFESSDGEEYMVTLKLSSSFHHIKIFLKWRESVDVFVKFTLYAGRHNFEKTNFCYNCFKACVCFDNLGIHVSDLTLIIRVVKCRNPFGHIDEPHQLPSSCINHTKADVCANHIEADAEVPKKVYAFHQRLSDDLKNLLVTGKDADIVLANGDHEISAHKFVLSLRSPVFARMLEHKMRESIENKITIDDISLEALKKLVEFLYSGEISIDSTEMAINLYIAADKYDIDNLKVASSNALMNVDRHNVFEIIKLANLYQDKSLKDSAMNFIVQNYAEVKSLELWQTFLNDNKTLAIEVLSCVADSKN